MPVLNDKMMSIVKIKTTIPKYHGFGSVSNAIVKGINSASKAMMTAVTNKNTAWAVSFCNCHPRGSVFRQPTYLPSLHPISAKLCLKLSKPFWIVLQNTLNLLPVITWDFLQRLPPPQKELQTFDGK